MHFELNEEVRRTRGKENASENELTLSFRGLCCFRPFSFLQLSETECFLFESPLVVIFLTGVKAQ